MLNKNAKIMTIGGLLLVLVIAFAIINSKAQDFGSSAGGEGTPTYIADPVNDQVINATPAILHSIIIGGGSLGITDASEVMISNSAINTVGSVIYYATGSNLLAVQGIPFNAYMTEGITITTTAINNISIFSSPR